MSLLLRRRALMASRAFNNWDGKECVAVGSDKKLYWSFDYGKTFTNSGLAANGYTEHACVTRNKARGENGAHIFFVYADKVFYSYMGNTTNLGYVQVGVGKSICANGDGTVAYVPINSGTSWQTGYTCEIKKITRSGNTLSAATKGTFSTWDQAADYASACSNDGKYAVIGGASGYTNGFQTVNTGETWTECLATSSYGNGMKYVCCNFEGSTFIACSQGGRNYSVNSLSSWTHGDSTNTNCEATTGVYGTNDIYFRFDASGGLKLYDRTGRSGYSPNTWTSIGSAVFIGCACNKTGNRAIGITNDGKMWYTENWGRTWKQSTVPSGLTFLECDMTKCD